IEQRPRQAYEDFGMRMKTTFFISLLPAAIALGLISGARTALVFFTLVSAGSVLVACGGLSRNKAYRVFPGYVVLYAPLWLLERALSVYWALYWRMAYGGYPFGDRILSKGTGRAWMAGRARMRAGLLSDKLLTLGQRI